VSNKQRDDNGQFLGGLTTRAAVVGGDGLLRWSEDSISGLKSALDGVRRDGWGNVLTGLGIASRDKRMGATFGASSRISQSRELLDEMFHGDDIVATICELPAGEMTREWFDLLIQPEEGDRFSDSDTADRVMQELDSLGAQPKFKEAITWARLYGGACIFIGINDGGTADQEVDVDNIESVDFLNVMDRFDLLIDERYEDPTKPKYGEPKIYKVNVGGGRGDGHYGLRIHETRILRFDGVLTNRTRRNENSGWSESVITRNLDVIRDFQSSFQGVAHLMTDFSQGVFKIKDLAKMLSSDKDGLVLKRLQMLDYARSMVRAIPLDAEEDFERKGASVSGMAELLDRIMLRLSAATRIPVSLLMGRSPAGMNATGESDTRSFYDHISAQQEWALRPCVEWMLKVMLNAKNGPTSGTEPTSWGFEFNPLERGDPVSIAAERLANAQRDALYIQNGVVTPDEVANSRYGGSTYSPEMTLDKSRRDTELDLRSEQILKRNNTAPGNALASVAGMTAEDPVVADESMRMDASYAPASPSDARSGRVCSRCAFSDGAHCRRFDSQTDSGFRCDDWFPSGPNRLGMATTSAGVGIVRSSKSHGLRRLRGK